MRHLFSIAQRLRRISWAIGVIGCAVAIDTNAETAPTTATTFANDLATQMHLLICDAAALNPDTLSEDNTVRQQRLARQTELERWFRDKGRSISPAKLENDSDVRNYREFRDTMANVEFLRMRYRHRRRFLTQVNAYFAELTAHFSPSLDLFLSHDRTGAARRHVIRQLSTPISVKTRYFGHNTHTGTGAIYHPPTHTIYLNINIAADDPADFVDTFEHELWHHLLPLGQQPLRNLWWEGFTEALAECWSAERPRGKSRLRPSQSVQYPIQTAFASLLLGFERGATLAWLVGELSSDQLAATLQAGDNWPAIRHHLAHTITTSTMMPEQRHSTVVTMLSNWGWQEDDGSTIDISDLMSGAQLDATAIKRAQRYRKRLLMDLIQATTILNLQPIRSRHIDTWTRDLQLPKNLRRNLRRVLKYTENPYHQLANQ